MQKRSYTAFTLLELIIYIGLLLMALSIILYTINLGLRANDTSGLFLERSRNVASAERYISKATENISDYLIVSGEQSQASFNGYNFTLTHIINQCNFVVEDRYNLIAFTTYDSLDPTIIGVIQGERDGREYRQLAIYRYYSTYSELERIKQDYEAGRILNYVDSTTGGFRTEGLTPYKCNPDNGFLMPISSKLYIDNVADRRYANSLHHFLVIPYAFANRDISRVRLVEMQLGWESRIDNNATIINQVFSRNFMK